MNDDVYQGMSLDEIIQLTDSDHRHSTELDEQADGAARLRDRVVRALDAIDAASARLTGSQWGAVTSALFGHSGDAALERVRDLSKLTGSAREAMEPQAGVMQRIAERARTTHEVVAELRTERETWLRMVREDPTNPKLQEEFGGWPGLVGVDKDSGELEESIRQRYDTTARDIMTDAGTAYLDEAQGLQSIGSYRGPRIPREDSPTGRAEGEFHYRPGPSLEPRPPSGGPVGGDAPVPGTPPPSPVEPVPGFDSGPELQTGVGTVPAAGPSMPPPPAPVGDVYVPGKAVLPPVIGSRPSPPGSRGPIPSPAPTRQPTGLSRPVIGARNTPGMPTARPGATGIPHSMANTARGVGGVRGGQPPLGPGGVRGGRTPLGSGANPARSATGVPNSMARDTKGGSGFRPAPTVPAGRSNTSATGIPGSMAKNSRGVTGAPSGTGATKATGPHARPAAGVPGSMARTTRAAAAAVDRGRSNAAPRAATAASPGVRGTRGTSHEPGGRVIGRRTPAPTAMGGSVRATRAPRVVHGGNENLNRSVIGNMRSASPPSRNRRRTDDFDDFDDFEWDRTDRR